MGVILGGHFIEIWFESRLIMNTVEFKGCKNSNELKSWVTFTSHKYKAQQMSFLQDYPVTK
jgi:hypothetical protein